MTISAASRPNLGAGGELDPDVRRSTSSPRSRARRPRSRPRSRSASRVPAEEQEGVEAGDLGEVGHHDHVGDARSPSRRSSPSCGPIAWSPRRSWCRSRGRRGSCSSRPRRRGTSARRLISRIAGDWKATAAAIEAEGRGEAVAGGGRGDADDDAGDEPDRVLLQALVADRSVPGAAVAVAAGSGLMRSPPCPPPSAFPVRAGTHGDGKPAGSLRKWRMSKSTACTCTSCTTPSPRT